MVTIYCPNGNPNLSLFQAINNLSDNVMFVGDFNSKLESFSIWSYAQKYSKATLTLIKEKRRLTRQYSQIKDPAVKKRINQLQNKLKRILG